MYLGQSVKGKLFVLSIFFLLILIIMAVFFYFSISGKLIENAENIMRNNTLTTAEVIDKANIEAVTTSRIMALAQKTGMFGSRENSLKYAKEILQEYPDFAGVYFGYEPDSDGNDHLYSLNHKNLSHSDTSGRFLPYWYREKEQLKLTPLIDMESSLYYAGCREKYLKTGKEDYNITEPYFYQGRMLVEYTYPVVINSSFKGIAGIDRYLNSIFNYSDLEMPYNSTGFILISREGNILFSDIDLCSSESFNKIIKNENIINKGSIDRKMLTFNISQTDNYEILKKFYKMDENYSIPVKAFNPAEELKQFYYYSAAKIHTGEWTLVMRVSENEILYPVYSSFYTLFAFSVFFILFIYFLTLRIGRQITDPINKVIKSAAAMQNGKFDFEETGSAVKELDNLTMSLYKTAKQRKIAEEKLEESKNELQKIIQRQYVLVKESEAKYRNLFDNANDAILILENKIFTECNRKALEMFGCGEEYIIGRYLFEISPEKQGDGSISREKAEGFLNAANNGISEIFEWLHKKADGTVFETEISLNRISNTETSMLMVMIRDISVRKKAERERAETIKELTEALENIKTLKGLLPICSHCKKIRDDEGYWNKIEKYIEVHTDASFTHGLCPDCIEKFYKNNHADKQSE